MSKKIAKSLLFEMLTTQNITIPKLSKKLGLSHQTLYRLKNGSSISQRSYNLLFRFYTRLITIG